MSPTPESAFLPPATGFRAWQDTPASVRVFLLLAVALVVAIAAYLAPQWRHNPDLAHGWLTPLAFFFLLQEARRGQAPRFLPDSTGVCFLALATAATGLLLFGIGVLFLAALEWSHALVAATFTASCSLLLAGGAIACATTRTRLLPFNWTIAVAILLWLLSTPLPPGTYASLTATLQTAVTAGVLSSLHLLGIAAVRHGNIIQLPHAIVGVEDACSGIRSLLTCLYAGFFFSAVWLRRPAARVLLLVLAAVLAVGMNLVRSLTLTLLAQGGVAIEGFWHDATGYTVVAATAVLLALTARRLGVPMTSAESPKIASRPNQAPAGPAWLSQVLSLALVAVLVASAGLFFAVRRTQPVQPAPDLAAFLPEHFEGWTARREPALYQFSAQLQTTSLTQTTYYRQNDPLGREVTLYLAYWPAGQVPVSQVALHTPDACWPGSGWQATPVSTRRVALTLAGRTLPAAEQRIFTQNEQIQHVWYWHLYDGRVIHPDDVRSPRHLLRLAWDYGFHRTGDQLFVRLSSNQPWDNLADEALVRELFNRLKPFGL